MELIIRFDAGACKYAVEHSEKKVGLRLIDKAREEVGYLISVEEFVSPINAWREDIEVEVTEIMARDSGYFWDENKATVTVSRGFLNQYTEIKLKRIIDYYAKGEHRSSFEYMIDEASLLHDWRGAGYPLKWGFEGEEE